MFRRVLLILALANSLVSIHAQPYSLLTNVGGRNNTASLDGKWQVIIDPFERGSFDYHRNPLKSGFESRFGNFSDLNTLFVPGDWNSQRTELLYYEGVIWYRKQFEYKKKEGTRCFIHFGAVSYKTEVYLNGQKLGQHIGGYTPFNYEVTGILIDGVNNLVLKVDNKREADGVPSMMFDWWNFGGITRPVTLIETPATFIKDYSIYLDKEKSRNIKGWVRLDGTDSRSQVIIEIPELKIVKNITVDEGGIGYFEFTAAPEHWTPENPKLYMVSFVREGERVTEKIGFRTIETNGNKILLNGKPIFLKGVNMHAQLHGRSAYSKEDAACMLGWAKELGCNFVRLAHYPHSEETIRMAEELGILVWSEIPVYWAIQWDNPETYLNAEAQLDAMIARDKNRANVIIWSLANETPEGKERLEFLTRLANRARSMDQQRLISAALLPKEAEPDRWTVTDEFASVVDVIGFNQYIGWFNGSPEKCERIEWFFHMNKPIVMSEFGSSAPYGRHGEKTDRYTEEFQEYYYEKTIEMIKRIPGLSGTCPWNLTEHRSPRLILPNIEDGFSRAGLISGKGQKKKAYYVMKRFYQEF